MHNGKPCGDSCIFWGMRLFVDEDGYTTIAMAIALLVSLTLVFATATLQWGSAQAAEIQDVADSASMAGSNCVAAFSTITQVLDACVLSLGIAGVVVYAGGLVMAAIPFVHEAAPKVIEAGKQILEMRQSFARSATEGITKFEAALPALIALNAASCVQANTHGGTRYAGIAIPYPTESQSVYQRFQSDVNDAQVQEDARHLQEATTKKADAEKREAESKEKAWKADCIDNPMCMRSRASSLAGLDDTLNPYIESPRIWHFAHAKARALHYYKARLESEGLSTNGIDEIKRSEARRRFFSYAVAEISAAPCTEEVESTDIQLPELAHNSEMVRNSSLYTDASWPCSQEKLGRTLHCSMLCDGASGPYVGQASLLDLENGSALYCDVCCMDVHDMGNVANASTNIPNGFEHYWRIVVEASRDFCKAREDGRRAEQEMQDAADKSEQSFKNALKQLAVERPRLCPPGAYGCIAFVMRGMQRDIPHELTHSFLQGQKLGTGVAISASTLAPDNNEEYSNILKDALDGLEKQDSALLRLVDGGTDLWAQLLLGYGDAFQNLSNITNNFIDGIANVFGKKVAQSLKSKLVQAVETSGFRPCDMRLRKPVLVNSQAVLDQAGVSQVAQVRSFIQSLPEDGDALMQTCLDKVRSELGQLSFTIAELPLPGGLGTIPITIKLSQLGVG